MASYAGTLKDEKGNSFYPKSANDHKTIGTTSNFFSDLYCNMFARDPSVTGHLALKIGNVKFANENFMITVKGHFYNYWGVTEWEASCYFFNNGSNTTYQQCKCKVENTNRIKEIYWATGTDGYVYLVFTNGGQEWSYSTIFVDKVYISWSTGGYEKLWTGWGTSLVSSFDGFTVANICEHVGDALAHYPVGSIYITTNSTNPTYIIGGTWEQIKGRFLLGTGVCDANTDTYFGSIQAPNSWNAGVGSKGGEDFHTLTAAQMPEHRHYFSVTSGGGGSHYHTIRYGGAAGSNLIVSYESGSTSMLNLTGYQWVNAAYGNLYASSVADHTHAVSGNTGYMGSTSNHNNMPPYYAVYIWRRTA